MMQAPFDNIVQHLFHQPSLHSVTVEEIENMAQQHPYFAAAHFLLLKKMQDSSHPQFTDQLLKTSLYFNNPLWLQYLLQPGTVATYTVSPTPPFITEPAVEDVSEEGEEITNSYLEAIGEEDNKSSNPLPSAAQESAQPEQQPVGMMDLITEVFSDPNPLYTPTIPIDTATEEITTEETRAEEINAIETTAKDNAEEHHPAEEHLQHAQTPQHTDEELHEEHTPSASFEPNNIDAAAERDTSMHEGEGSNFTGEQVEEEPTIAVAEEAPNPEPAIIETKKNADDLQKQQDIAVEDQQAEVHELSGDEELTSKRSQENLINEQEDPETPGTDPEPSTDQPLLTALPTATESTESFAFEPYHTVDYFASQGIKLSKAETESKDKLGRQLRSFTDWLKTMKKLPQVSMDTYFSGKEEQQVVADASHSIEKKEVITETMAEVLEKQGMNEEAIEVYRKLSLQNPAKSAYFAARIDVLKR